MNSSKPNPMQIILPVVSLLISGILVGHEYYRAASLRLELGRVEREYDTLRAKVPKGSQIKLREPDGPHANSAGTPDDHHD